ERCIRCIKNNVFAIESVVFFFLKKNSVLHHIQWPVRAYSRISYKSRLYDVFYTQTLKISARSDNAEDFDKNYEDFSKGTYVHNPTFIKRNPNRVLEIFSIFSW